MANDLENPTLIDEGLSRTSAGKAPAPLVMIHDGGGTTFSYHCLNPIGRPLWGIYNARLDEGGYWEGGVPAIARHYIGMLPKVLPAGGDIILGGWSFGGIISMEMAHQLATATPQSDDAPRFRVLGIIMVDTVLSRELTSHLPRSAATPPRPPREEDVPVTKTAEELRVMSLKEKVDLNMKHAGMMTRAWDLPRWSGDDGVRVPRTIMLRARDHVGAEAGRGVPAPIDYARDQFRMLGWEKYTEEVGEFIENVVDLDGNHYSIFEFDKIDKISVKIKAAADRLDAPVS